MRSLLTRVVDGLEQHGESIFEIALVQLHCVRKGCTTYQVTKVAVARGAIGRAKQNPFFL